MNKRLAKAAEIAKAADACSSAGSCDAAMEVAMSIDQLLYESDDTADGSQSDAAHSKEQQPLNEKYGAILKIA